MYIKIILPCKVIAVYACIANRGIRRPPSPTPPHPPAMAQFFTPHCPEIPQNNVYVGANIRDHVINGAAVFIKKAGKPGSHATVSALPNASSAADLQFLGVSSITKRSNSAHHSKRARYQATGAPQNSVSVAVAGSVTLMCEKSSGIVPGQWVSVSANNLATDMASGLQCANIVPFVPGNKDLRPIGVCLSMASDMSSITVLLRRDAFYHYRTAKR